MVQRISWMDPARNEYEEDTPFDARIENNTDLSKLRLSDEIKFPRNPDGSFNFDPLSNIAYRVIIARAPQPRWIWVGLTYGFIGLFAFACAEWRSTCGGASRRRRGCSRPTSRWSRPTTGRGASRRSKKGESSGATPRAWTCSSRSCKTAGRFSIVVQTGGCDFNFGPLPVRFSILMKLGSRLFSRRPQLSGGSGRSVGGGNVMALDTLIQFLVCRRRLSPFVGLPESAVGTVASPAWPIEWEALNDIASRHFQQLGICDKRVEANLGQPAQHPLGVVSNHFRGVIKKATHDASLFRQTWTVREPARAGPRFTKASCRLRCSLEPERLGHGEQGAHGSGPAGRQRAARVVRRRQAARRGCSARFSTGRSSAARCRCTSSLSRS